MALKTRRNSYIPGPASEPFHPNGWALGVSVPGARTAAKEESAGVDVIVNSLRLSLLADDADSLRAAYADSAGDDLEMARASRSAGIRGLNRAEQE